MPKVLQSRYEVVSTLGQGGMGTVYMARDTRLHNRPCVVKKLRDDFYREEDKQKAISFFQREAGVLSTLEHDNIVNILDYFVEGDEYFFVMEYVEGQDLQAVLTERGNPFSEAQLVEWISQILDVLDYLHEHDPSVIYRDLKPSNIMLDIKGKVKLVDFGIARQVEENSEGTHVVSVGYSPPEQYWGVADARSDIYALGATMYFLLTGIEPLALHVSSPVKERPAISAHMDNVVQKATAQDPSLRYQSAKEMKEDLLDQPEEVVQASPRNHTLEILVGVAVLIVACLALFAYQKIDQLVNEEMRQIDSGKEPVKGQAMPTLGMPFRLKIKKHASNSQP